MIERCLDCGWYCDVTDPESFLSPFGDTSYICQLCAEERGLEPR